MTKVTYLFGAGASANVLPVVNQIPARLEELLSELEQPELKMGEELIGDNRLNDHTAYEYQRELIDDLLWLKQNTEEHASVDTFAKKLFLLSDYTNLDRLKNALSVFLLFQHKGKRPDKRYDTFLASIMTSLNDFPENLRILSWNYDLQFEQAYSQYMSKSVIENQRYLNVNEKYTSTFGSDKFGICKLNGSILITTFRGVRKFIYSHNLEGSLDKAFVRNAIKNYAICKRVRDIDNSLSFAWEPGEDAVNFMDSVREETKNSAVLVVIGYSFPFFNREIDRAIIQNMKSLKRVYFQAPDAENLKERFQAIRDDIPSENLIPKYDIEQFFLPNEL